MPTMSRIAFLLTFVLLLALPQIQAQQKSSDLQEQNLRGKVKSMEEWEYGDAEVIAGKGVYIDEGTEVVSHHICQFNRRGNLEEEKSFDSEGKMIGKNKYKYSEVGDLMESSEHNAKGKCCGRNVYAYNSHRQFATLTLFLSDGSIETATYHYSKERLLDSITWNNPVRRKEFFRYNGKGQLCEKQLFEDGKQVERNEFVYDGQGNIIEESRTTADGKRHKTLSTYDDTGRLQSVIQQDENGRQESRTCWEYDQYGNILVETWYNEENIRNVRSTCEYTYDAQGNWTQQIWFDDGKPFSVTRRKITYY